MNTNKIILSVLLISSFALIGCKNKFQFISMHYPLSPDADQSISFKLFMRNSDNVSYNNFLKLDYASLEIKCSSFDNMGKITEGVWKLKKEWKGPFSSTDQFLEYIESSGYPQNCLVYYRFSGKDTYGNNFIDQVIFTTKPYLANKPIPVYVHHIPDGAMDIVFIPDKDIPYSDFEATCTAAIKSGYYFQDFSYQFRDAYNFYINPKTGEAMPPDKNHVLPTNDNELSFAEGKCIIHNDNTILDNTENKIFSAYYKYISTITHEAGHGLYDLSDEYDGILGGNEGGWKEQLDHLPNIWNKKEDSEKDFRNDDTHDPNEVFSYLNGSKKSYYRLCNQCNMRQENNFDEGIYKITYGLDKPCYYRAIYCIGQNIQTH